MLFLLRSVFGRFGGIRFNDVIGDISAEIIGDEIATARSIGITVHYKEGMSTWLK